MKKGGVAGGGVRNGRWWADLEATRLVWINGKELLRAAGMAAVYPMGWVVGKALDSDQGMKRRPVILVHGFFHNRSAFLPLLYRLRVRGWSTIRTVNLPLFWGSIEAHAKHLARKVGAVLRETGQKDVDLIGHSLGGLVAWWYFTRLDGHRKVRRVITMGTPFQGTESARVGVGLGLGRLAAEMVPESPVIREVNAGYEDLRQRVCSIYAEEDFLVLPARNGTLPGARNRGHRGLGHLGLLYSGEVFGEIARELGGSPP